MKNLGFIFCLFLYTNFVFGQIESAIDTTRIKIGEPIKLTYKLKVGEKDQVKFPVFKDTLSYHIEIINQKLDTISLENGQKELVQNLEVSSYEPGEFLIKPIKIIKNQDTIRSKSFQIYVLDVNVDASNPQITANKPIMNEQYTLKDYWNKYWIYGLVALLLFVIAIVLVVLYIRSKNKDLKPKIIKSPFEEIIDELKSIDKKKYLERGEQKEFYSRLSNALKIYIGRIYHFSALELLSDELLRELSKKDELTKNDIEELDHFLYDADMVKFAKQKIEEPKNTTYRKWIEEFAKRIKPLEIPQNKDLTTDELTGENFRKIKD